MLEKLRSKPFILWKNMVKNIEIWIFEKNLVKKSKFITSELTK